MNALGQKARFLMADRVLEYPELQFEFDINFSADSDGNTGTLKFYNLSETTIGLMKKGRLITLSAGYRDDLGIIFPGVISSAKTTWERPEKITTLTVGDRTDLWLNSTINQTWRAGISASQVAKDIAAALSLEIGKIEIPKDLTYTRGKTFSCTCKQAMEEVAGDLGLKLHVFHGKIYLTARETGLTEVVILNANTGLMGAPEKNESNQKNSDNSERFQVQSLLNYRIQTDSVVKIESQKLTGLFRVDKGKHVLSGNDFLTEMEVVKCG